VKVRATSTRVCLMTPVFVPWDAIGNDIRGMADALRAAGYPVEVYATSIHPELQSEARLFNSAKETFSRDEATLLIYHHSMGWPQGQELLSNARCRVVIRHHNVTPPRFWYEYSAEHVEACKAGEQASRELARRPDSLFWGASSFNVEDLIGHGAPRAACRVLPPFHLTEELARAPLAPDVVLQTRQNSGLKILFVGGIKPNKGHLRLIRTLAAVRRYADPEAILVLPGRLDPRLESYTDKLRRTARQLGVEKAVIFPGSVDESELRSWYFSSDVFLCLSEHEGFCVPLVEAMYFRLPIVTHKSTAIPATVGDAALLWDEDDADGILESLMVCRERDDRCRTLTRAARERYSNVYSIPQIRTRFLNLVDEAISA
jgi:glycosyltransferase involved in cell wall biosynthesis